MQFSLHQFAVRQAQHAVAMRAHALVVGRHHHGRIAKFLVGSTSESTAKHAECPLVIVPCDEPEADAVERIVKDQKLRGIAFVAETRRY